jgi:hypothetical protein
VLGGQGQFRQPLARADKVALRFRWASLKDDRWSQGWLPYYFAAKPVMSLFHSDLCLGCGYVEYLRKAFRNPHRSNP